MTSDIAEIYDEFNKEYAKLKKVVSWRAKHPKEQMRKRKRQNRFFGAMYQNGLLKRYLRQQPDKSTASYSDSGLSREDIHIVKSAMEN